MRYGSVCSGIEAVSLAWEPLGMEPAWFSEIDPFACAYLAHHYPHVPNLGDMTKISEADLDRAGPIDVLVGGTPCQSFSVAGLRGGLADPRGNLALVFLELARRTRARWVVFENVPGVLSADGGRAMGAFLGGLAELGYGFSYRVLDAQYLGLAQRRKRVFVVAHSGGLWQRAAAVLLERSSLRWDPAPSREEGERAAGSLEAGPTGRGWRVGADEAGAEHLVAFHVTQDPISGEVAPAMGAGNRQGCGTIGVLMENGGDVQTDGTPHLRDGHTSGVPRIYGHGVRRLTPRECERLQGFPDDRTLVPYRGKPASDGPRYRALGNSMAVPVLAWIGHRLLTVEGIRS